jgi:hypothetical protein
MDTDPNLAPQITALQIVPEAVCGSADVSFTVTDPNQDMILWEAMMNVTAFGNVEQTSGSETSGRTVTIKFLSATNFNHRHRVVLTVSARDSAGNQAEPARLEFLIFYPC